MAGPNVLDLVGDIREAVERLPKDQLVDILVYVFKEYVVEGAPLLSAAPAALPDDLAGMSFAEVVRSLQLRLDLPELELFDVQGERVTVRLQGRSLALEVGPARTEPLPAPPPVPAPVTAPSAPAAPRAAAQQAGPTPAPPAAVSPTDAGAAAPAATQQGPAAATPGSPRSGGLLEID